VFDGLLAAFEDSHLLANYGGEGWLE